MLARVLELIEKYLRTRTCIAQEILGPHSTRLQNAHGAKLLDSGNPQLVNVVWLH